jgi:multidrug efflux pump subunit AcrA (membrane-fusion protein)
MDPLRAPNVIRALPADRVAVVAAVLARREQWVVMSGFVALVSPAALRAAIAVLDGGQLLQIGYVLDDDVRLGEVTALLSDRQLDGMLAAAADRALWTELDGLLARLDDAGRSRVAHRCHEPRFVAAAEAAVAAGQLSAGVLGMLQA